MTVASEIDRLFARWTRAGSPGCAVAVRQGTSTIYAAGYGLADVEHAVPIIPTTVFHVASLSKQFTAFAILQLVAQKKLSLNDDVRTYVPEVPRLGARITLRHLLYHTSGLRDHMTLLRLAGWRRMDEKTESDILELVQRQRALNFRPGDDFTYCNTGYLLLAVIIKRVSRRSFQSVMAQEIFQPLGMKASRFREQHTELVRGRAFAYTPRENGQFGFSVPNFDFVGSTGLYTTVGDLLRWASNFWSSGAGRAALFQQLCTTGRLNSGLPIRYGAGVELSAYRGLSMVKHSGWDLGYMAHLAVYPAQHFAVAILGNVSTLPAERLSRRIADICLGARFPHALPQSFHLSRAKLRARAGFYRHPASGRAASVRLVGGILRVAFDGSRGPTSGAALTALDATHFRGPDETMQVVFERRRVSIGEDYGVPQQFDRVGRWAPPARALREYEGTYRSPELDASLTFSVNMGRLLLEERKAALCALSPAYRDAFTCDPNNPTTCIFTRDRRGRINGVELSSERVSRLRFNRVL